MFDVFRSLLINNEISLLKLVSKYFSIVDCVVRRVTAAVLRVQVTVCFAIQTDYLVKLLVVPRLLVRCFIRGIYLQNIAVRWIVLER